MINRLRRLHSDEDGQVMWVFAMAAMALVVLAGLVMNTGRQISRKIEMQNASDAAAVSSATWMARGMNVISMDNVGMTEALGLIANLRAMHLAWQLNEVLLSAEALVAELLIDGIFTAPAGIALMATVYVGWIPTCTAELADMQDCALFEGPFFPPTGMHFSEPGASDSVFDGPWSPGLSHPQDGLLWKFMSALESVNKGVQVASPALAFAQAVNVGNENITHGNDFRMAVMLPNFGNGDINADSEADAKQITGGYGLPVAGGDFHELCDPTQNGTLSVPLPDAAVKTRGYSPLGYKNFFGETYSGSNHGPFAQYKDDFVRFWMPSLFTGIPGIYDVMAKGSMSLFCGGDVPPLPSVKTRVAPLAKAVQTPGATDFTWSYTEVRAFPVRPAADCDSNCFNPLPGTTATDQASQALRGSQPTICSPGDIACLNNGGCLRSDTICLQNWAATHNQDAGTTVQNTQNAQSSTPSFGSAVDPNSYHYRTVTQQDSSYPFSPYVGPCREPRASSWCRLAGTDTFEQITTESSSRCPAIPSPAQNAPPPPPPQPCQVVHDERFTFQYATATQSIGSLKGGSGILQQIGNMIEGDTGDFPKPMHFTLDPGDPGYDLSNHPGDLNAAIERMQYLVVAYRRSTGARFMEGARVSTSSRSALVFGSPDADLGILTYAQSQVYNPTSWDLYTQDWHAKLVPASMLERSGTRFNQTSMDNIFQVTQAVARVLNAH